MIARLSLLAAVIAAISFVPGCKKENMILLSLKGTQWKVSDTQQELYIDFTRGNKIVTWIKPAGYDCFLPAGGTNLRYEQSGDSLKFEVRNTESGKINTVRLGYEAGAGKVTFTDAATKLRYVVKQTESADRFVLFDPVKKGDVELTKVDLKADKLFKVCEMSWEEYVKEKMKSLLEKQNAPIE